MIVIIKDDAGTLRFLNFENANGVNFDGGSNGFLALTVRNDERSKTVAWVREHDVFMICKTVEDATKALVLGKMINDSTLSKVSAD